MRQFFAPSEGFSLNRLVYRTDVSAEVTLGAGDKEAEGALPEVAYDPTKKTEDEQWKLIDEKYGKGAYESIISAYVDKIMPASGADHKSVLLKDSVARYMKSYDRIRLTFMSEAKELRVKFDEAVDRAQNKTKSELAVLKSAVEGGRPLAEFKESMPGPEDKDAVKDHFENYLEALNGRYFNGDVNEGYAKGPGLPLIDPLVHVEAGSIPLLGPLLDPRAFDKAKYRDASEQFQKNMKNWVMARLDWMLEKKETQKTDLEAFKAELLARYESYAKIDGNSSIISSADLKSLEAAAHPPLDALARILDESDDKAIKRLELIQLMNPEGWEETIEMAGQTIIQAAINNGSENEFVAQMKKHKDVKDFDEAKDAFEDRLAAVSKVGVKETLDFIREFNGGVHSAVLEYEKSVRPPSLTLQVNKQMDYLLTGVLTPQKDTDRMLVRFMSSDRDARNEILAQDSSREVLFRAIRQATEQYPEIYDKQFANIPDDVTKLRRSTRIEQPTFHDRAAQMQALIILGNQAKVIVSQLQRTPENAGKDYVAEIGNARIPDDPSVVLTGLRFGSSHTPRFRSALERGGFNGTDLALKGAKVLGVMAMISNAAQSWSETHGDFVDRVLDTVEKSVTNPGFLVGAGVAAGSHMAERDKRFLRYPWLSQHERASTVTAFKLDNLAARVGFEEMNRFIQNNAEWRALADPAMDPTQIKELLQESAKRTPRGAHPIIAVSDLRKVIKDESILTTLTTEGKSSRMRYLFYEKFFSSAVKPDVNHIKQLCTGSSHISASPVRPS